MKSENFVFDILKANVPEFFNSKFYNPSFDSYNTFLFQDLMQFLEYLIDNLPESQVVYDVINLINDICASDDGVMLNILSTDGFIGLHDDGIDNNQKYLHFIYPYLTDQAKSDLHITLKLWLGDRFDEWDTNFKGS